MPTKITSTNGTPKHAAKINPKRNNPPDFHWERPTLPAHLSAVDCELIAVGREVLDIVEKRKADIAPEAA